MKNFRESLGKSFLFLSLILTLFCTQGCNRIENFGTYEGYNISYQKNELLENDYHCETLLNFKFCYEKGYALQFCKEDQKISLKIAVAYLILKPDDIQSLFESFDAKHPRNYKKTYKEIGAPYRVQPKYPNHFYAIKETSKISDVYFYPQFCFSFYEYSLKDMYADGIGAEIEYSLYDLFMKNFGNVNPEDSFQMSDHFYLCYYQINVEKVSHKDLMLLLYTLYDSYFTYAVTFTGPLPLVW